MYEKYAVKDSIVLDSLPLNSFYFKVLNKKQQPIDSTFFKVDYPNATVYFNNKIKKDSVYINYLKFPEFLTKTYYVTDPSLIISDEQGDILKYLANDDIYNKKREFIPFEGLSSSGSISRGVTVGNNQNSVLNSALDLQLYGKLNDKIMLKASIQDSDIPLQDSGYSQQLDEFDQIFIELSNEDKWTMRAGDIDLVRSDSHYTNFTKKIQGLSILTNVEAGTNDLELFTSGAIVRGQFTSSKFNGQEGNQGPYKLKGPNGELFVLIVSGSETVFVNGLPVERGENKDYVIDYNAGEITFNPTYPINSEMRITVDYQFSERSYSTYNLYSSAKLKSEKVQIGVSFYSDSDSKNQPLLQNLSDEQKKVLKEAGDDKSKMVAASAVPENYSENKILYKKSFVDGVEVFEFSNNENDELFDVRFSLVGNNNGDYIIENSNAITNIFKYVSPIFGVPQGSYAPIINLVAPVKKQVVAINANINPSDNTNVYLEFAGTKNDLNLFSDLDKEDDNGFATTVNLKQNVLKKNSEFKLNVFSNNDFIHSNFNSIQRIYNAEFNRDWNLAEVTGNQVLNSSGVEFLKSKKFNLKYFFDYLTYTNHTEANKHNLVFNSSSKSLNVFTKSSYLVNNTLDNNSRFFRTFNKLDKSIGKKSWTGIKFSAEDNQQKLKLTDSLTALSQRFQNYEAFYGIGDSTKVFVEVGAKLRFNDSLRGGVVKPVNKSYNYYLKSKVYQTKSSDLYLNVNYRDLKSVETSESFKTINSRIIYNQRISNVVNLNTLYETNSGKTPLQDFTYVEVEPGQGVYTWIDYNDNGIQELNEFEVAQFNDEAKFIRVLLPNQVYVNSNQKKLSNTLNLNFIKYAYSKTLYKRVLGRFANQTQYIIDRKNRVNNGELDLNPFDVKAEEELSLLQNIRNSVFFNRGKQKFSTTYSVFNNKSRNFLSTGFQDNTSKGQQINILHNFFKIWLLNLEYNYTMQESKSENFENRNFNIAKDEFVPTLTYLIRDNFKLDFSYLYSLENNLIGDNERLERGKISTSFQISDVKKGSLVLEVSYINNNYTGVQNSAVAYQMLEGLNPGKNFTWSVIAQKKLTKFLDLNVNYFGRKSEISKVIHNGTVQLKAYF